MKNILLFIGFLSFASCTTTRWPLVGQDHVNNTKTIRYQKVFDTEPALARTFQAECGDKKHEVLKEWQSESIYHFLEFRCIP